MFVLKSIYQTLHQPKNEYNSTSQESRCFCKITNEKCLLSQQVHQSVKSLSICVINNILMRGLEVLRQVLTVSFHVVSNHIKFYRIIFQFNKYIDLEQRKITYSIEFFVDLSRAKKKLPALNCANNNNSLRAQNKCKFLVETLKAILALLAYLRMKHAISLVLYTHFQLDCVKSLCMSKKQRQTDINLNLNL